MSYRRYFQTAAADGLSFIREHDGSYSTLHRGTWWLVVQLPHGWLARQLDRRGGRPTGAAVERPALHLVAHAIYHGGTL